MEPEIRPSVLLVDDKTANLLALEVVLEPLNVRLVRANSGHEALELVALQEFAVILLDVQMPGLDGFQTAFRMRESTKISHTPIIFLTATDMNEGDLLRGYSEGAVDVLCKPYSPAILRSKVRSFVLMHEKSACLKAAERRLRKLNSELEQRVEERTAELRQSEQRAHILSAVSAALADSLDYRTVLRRVVALPVSDFADWCALHALDEHQSVTVIATARATGLAPPVVRVEHVDPNVVTIPEEVREVFECGRSRYLRRVPDTAWEEISPPAAPDNSLRALGLKSAISIPIKSRGRILGALTLATARGAHLYGPADLEFAEELARRAAVAMDNALLYHAAQEEIVLRRRAEELARKSKGELADFCENAPVPLHWLGPDGTILWANDAELDLLGYTRDEYVGRRVTEFYADPERAEEFLERLSRNETLHDFEACLRRRDGTIRDVLISSNVLWDEDRFVHTRCFTRDMTERKRMEEALAHGAYHDALTGLSNRVAFYEQVERSLAHALRRAGYGFAVLFMDLDRFKQINDTLGHAAGDELLIATARRIEESLRPGDTAARLGGDEFTILLDDIADAEGAALVAGRILSNLQRPFLISGQEISLTPSIGVALRDESHVYPQQLIHAADAAMYIIKARGGNGFEFASQSLIQPLQGQA